ncbi:MAG: hypothetical protein M1817_004956 [Caeruleum heppii]|nr:MAG: hypothetical protein M1817_004956 [Caeruleum heppii]
MGLEVGGTAGSAYEPPHCFGTDCFEVLGRQRPDSRWLIVGPERSGSTFHKDPNATSAWNAVLKGSKYWIMFPGHPNAPSPPGVFVSEDQSEVTSPLSIAEWLMTFHAEARAQPGCLEGICGEGEVLHVPSGWWHLVVNLSPAIAITQNFVPRQHVVSVLLFLRDKPDQVSGFPAEVADPYHLFVERLRETDPALLDEAIEQIEHAEQGKKRKWDDVVRGQAEAGGADVFSFGFGFEGSDNGEEEDCDHDEKGAIDRDAVKDSSISSV